MKYKGFSQQLWIFESSAMRGVDYYNYGVFPTLRSGVLDKFTTFFLARPSCMQNFQAAALPDVVCGLYDYLSKTDKAIKTARCFPKYEKNHNSIMIVMSEETF